MAENTEDARRMSRRQMLKTGGIAALGLAFTAPSIQMVSAKPAFKDYGDRKDDDKRKEAGKKNVPWWARR
jgi:hypothetical protein